MKIIQTILNRNELRARPPVLLDIGASGEVYGPWKEIAPYSICIAFDPDSREMKHLTENTSPFKELYIRDSVVIPGKEKTADFYLTASPFCSSTLKPDTEKTAHWIIGPRFEVEKRVTRKAENINDVLSEIKLDRIDWFKTDSQGTDLSLFQSIGSLAYTVMVADFEPGIIDAYHGEDKAWQVLRYMEKMPFWMTTMRVMGVRRLKNEIKKSLSASENRALSTATSEAPGWIEMSFVNEMTDKSFTIREYLLMWIFATLKRQDGFALEIAERGSALFNDPLFQELAAESKKLVNQRYRYNRVAGKILRVLHTTKKMLKGILQQ